MRQAVNLNGIKNTVKWNESYQRITTRKAKKYEVQKEGTVFGKIV